MNADEQLLPNEPGLTLAEIERMEALLLAAEPSPGSRPGPAQKHQLALRTIAPTTGEVAMSGEDFPVMQLFLTGALPIEIAETLGLPLVEVQRIVRKKANQEFVKGLLGEVHVALRLLTVDMLHSLKGLINSSNDRTRLGAVREIAKINGLYTDEAPQRTSAEELVSEVLRFASQSMNFASGEQIRAMRNTRNADRFIDITPAADAASSDGQS